MEGGPSRQSCCLSPSPRLLSRMLNPTLLSWLLQKEIQLRVAMKPVENSFTMRVLLAKTFIPHGKWLDRLRLGGKGLGGGPGSAALPLGSKSILQDFEALCGLGETPRAEDCSWIQGYSALLSSGAAQLLTQPLSATCSCRYRTLRRENSPYSAEPLLDTLQTLQFLLVGHSISFWWSGQELSREKPIPGSCSSPTLTWGEC